MKDILHLSYDKEKVKYKGGHEFKRLHGLDRKLGGIFNKSMFRRQSSRSTCTFLGQNVNDWR